MELPPVGFISNVPDAVKEHFRSISLECIGDPTSSNSPTSELHYRIARRLVSHPQMERVYAKLESQISNQADWVHIFEGMLNAALYKKASKQRQKANQVTYKRKVEKAAKLSGDLAKLLRELAELSFSSPDACSPEHLYSDPINLLVELIEQPGGEFRSEYLNTALERLYPVTRLGERYYPATEELVEYIHLVLNKNAKEGPSVEEVYRRSGAASWHDNLHHFARELSILNKIVFVGPPVLLSAQDYLAWANAVLEDKPPTGDSSAPKGSDKSINRALEKIIEFVPKELFLSD